MFLYSQDYSPLILSNNVNCTDPLYESKYSAKYTSYLNTNMYMVYGYIHVKFIYWTKWFLDKAVLFNDCVSGEVNSNTCTGVLVRLWLENNIIVILIVRYIL